MLVFLCVTLVYIPRVLATFSHEPIQVSHKAIEKAEKQVSKQQEKRSLKKKAKKRRKPQDKYKAPSSKFDPNTYSKEDWMQLGLSEKQATVVLKFTERGIQSNEELRKIFVIPEEVFSLLEDSTFYPESKVDEKKGRANFQNTALDLNTASHEELVTLPGIGDFYAAKIIEKRSALGGFVGKYQLLELWKFGTERLERIESRITVTGAIQKLNINKADIETLKNHPYISYKVANSIVKMRAAHGDYEQVEELLRSVLIDRELLEKLQPYITL